MRYDSATARCDRCETETQVSRGDAPGSFQRGGWVTLHRVVFGASDDHNSRRGWDLCPECADSFSDWRLTKEDPDE